MLISTPEIIEATRYATLIGTSMYPAAVALNPWAIWKYVGRYDIAAIVAKRMINPPIVVSIKFLFLNRNNGMMGCFALASATANSTENKTAAATRQIITGLFQAYSTPPHDVAKVSAQTAAATNAMPQ